MSLQKWLTNVDNGQDCQPGLNTDALSFQPHLFRLWMSLVLLAGEGKVSEVFDHF